VACWRVLRQSVKLSGAVNGGDASTIDILGDSSSDDDESGSGSSSSRSRRNGGFQGLSIVIKAVKTQRQDDIQINAQVKYSTEALLKLATTQKMLERAGLSS